MKKNIDKLYGIYSLLFPFVLVFLFFILMDYGTATGDVVSRPLGKISDYITAVIAYVICPILLIANVVFFVLTVKRSFGNIYFNSFILIANALLCIQFWLAVMFFWFLVMTFIFIEPVYIVIWVVYLISFIIQCRKNINNADEGTVIKG